MIFKIKKFFLIIFLILLQSCSGGRIGNFFEKSFDDLDNINQKDMLKINLKENVLKNNKVINQEKKESNQGNNIKIKKLENKKNVLKNNKVINQEKKEINQENNIKIKKLENKKNVLKNKKDSNSQKINKIKNPNKKRKIDFQSYKLILILKNVDPKDPIEELSTILRNSEVDFEIEKIERSLESKNRSIKKN